ncbi:signal peptidase I [Streptomyces sp. NBC_00264]|uniref:signal peptidase I n=1 Tax=unclassified Streptomyces TaxID=2593676 RepID=UPI0022557135|nr:MULTISPECIES: signal peptidase I [unclassified Streptomyces]WSG55986.1 signal peptidase I [Streptomyces sp. NBC_01732]WSX07118.1 signal peptidase I [Streptomyces sp. NBC_00987]MCX5105535.1 signal peptidase I [Streptomyces sp. NBC_00439]MCX5163318.1 signal peptidase I [Streptomyces sp. NBC_00305]MCX5221842.1 signal peptidase I [Streptomyces sp. NBC_00264]
MAAGARPGQGDPAKGPDRSADPAVEPAADSAAGPAAGPVGGAPDPDTPVDEQAPDGDGRKAARKQRPFWKELPLLIVVALVLALLIKTFLVQAFSIPSDSMQNTLQRGDRVLVDKLTPWFGGEPERGEVVVFHDPDNWLAGEPTPESNVVQDFLSFIGLMPSSKEKDLIKRTIAVGGDTVECAKGGPVKVNGKALDEPYIFPGNTACDDKPFGPFKVPEGKIWVMGDHRQNSLDSRYHTDEATKGFVPVEDVVGRAVVVAWPINRWATLPVPDTFDQPGISAAAGLAPGAVGIAGALPLVLWRRRRLTGGRTAG